MMDPQGHAMDNLVPVEACIRREKANVFISGFRFIDRDLAFFGTPHRFGRSGAAAHLMEINRFYVRLWRWFAQGLNS